MEEWQLTLKLSPLTNEELEFIRWRIWEPLRRNQYYINEYHRLKTEYFSDFDTIKAFCEKWKLPHPICPNTDFEQLTQSLHPWVISPFDEYYEPLFDHAAFVDPQNWIVNGKFLIIWINLNASKNQIEKAIKKELDEWWSDKWPNFYGGIRRRKTNTAAVKFKSTLSSYIEILINLKAPRTTEIEPALKVIINEYQKHRTSKNISRLHPNRWAEAFDVYDRVKKRWSFENIAISKGKDKKTIHKQYKRAYESIYPDTVFKEREDKPRIVKAFLRPTMAKTYDRNGEIEQHDIASREYLNDGDCPYCQRSLCVIRTNTGHNVCQECGREQKIGKLYRDLMKI